MSTIPTLCPCGRPLHYSSHAIESYIQHYVEILGPTLDVTTPAGTWAVPRHYIALHGLKANELPELAQHYGWAQLSPSAPEPGRRRS